MLLAMTLILLLAGYVLAEGTGSHHLTTLGSYPPRLLISYFPFERHTSSTGLPLFDEILPMLERAQQHGHAATVQECCISHTTYVVYNPPF